MSDFDQRVRGEITAAEYVRRLRARVAQREAEQMGTDYKPRGIVSTTTIQAAVNTRFATELQLMEDDCEPSDAIATMEQLRDDVLALLKNAGIS